MSDTKQKSRLDRGLYWDRAWSICEGCTPVSEGCINCWAAAQTHMRASNPNAKIQARYSGLTYRLGRFNDTIRLMWDDMLKPLSVKTATCWAIWNDLFHPEVTRDFLREVFETMVLCPQHTFLVLTKRPNRMGEYLRSRIGIPSTNVWFGTTVELFEHTWRIYELAKFSAAVRYLSLEPLLGVINLKHTLDSGLIHWVIVGCESGPRARPCPIENIRSIVGQCKAANVLVFVKQIRLGGKVSRDMAEWPEDLRVREMPLACRE